MWSLNGFIVTVYRCDKLLITGYNYIQEEDSKLGQMIYPWWGLTLKKNLENNRYETLGQPLDIKNEQNSMREQHFSSLSFIYSVFVLHAPMSSPYFPHVNQCSQSRHCVLLMFPFPIYIPLYVPSIPPLVLSLPIYNLQEVPVQLVKSNGPA